MGGNAALYQVEDPHLVAAAHRQAGARVPRLVADQVLVARVLEREQLDDEQDDERGNRVEDQLRHARNRTKSRRPSG